MGGTENSDYKGQFYCAAQERSRTLFPKCFGWLGTGPVLTDVVASESLGQLYTALSS